MSLWIRGAMAAVLAIVLITSLTPVAPVATAAPPRQSDAGEFRMIVGEPSSLDPNITTLAVVFPLYLLSLSGIALTLSGIGLVLKRANALSNLVSPFFILLGGVYYPVAELPDWLRIPARLLPLGYGMESITAATLERATLSHVQSSALPLAAFALVSPIVGILAFNALEHLVRRRGEIDLY